MYVGPETLMPLASILAAVTGVVMLFRRRTVEVVRMAGGPLTRMCSDLLGRS